MKNISVHKLVIFSVITLLLFFFGVLGTTFSMINYNNVRQLENSKNIEYANIIGIEKRPRSMGNNLVSFRTVNDNKLYRTHIITSIVGNINIGDEIIVKFNDEKSTFLITNYSFAIYFSFYLQIGLFIFCFIISIPLFISTIFIFKQIS